ncbi:hypothetical protein Taro_011735 [Colocasia esculenta]|uniref:Uncharacterized protein n=1 Tax=Colocasia esculenta TaxID=4460 RepID=A0A843U6R0_COLES|nr:hypothetical protein [Colocasia esculenta]
MRRTLVQPFVDFLRTFLQYYTFHGFPEVGYLLLGLDRRWLPPIWVWTGGGYLRLGFGGPEVGCLQSEVRGVKRRTRGGGTSGWVGDRRYSTSAWRCNRILPAPPVWRGEGYLRFRCPPPVWKEG